MVVVGLGGKGSVAVVVAIVRLVCGCCCAWVDVWYAEFGDAVEMDDILGAFLGSSLTAEGVFLSLLLPL